VVKFALEGRTALVTGGSEGIGLALARRLAAAGARVIIVGRDASKLDAAARSLGDATQTWRADLSQPAEVDRLIADLPARAPDLSLLINNAGSQVLTDFTGADPARHLASLRDEVSLNFSAVIALSVGLLPALSRQRSAAIVNITSGLALAPKKSSPVYCAAKAGVRSFTRALRYQCEDKLAHVRIVEALPPIVDTGMTRGRGSGKISADACAAEIIRGLQAGHDEIYVAKSKLLRTMMRMTP
jgi:uncharacterized oxidoreductase